MDFILIVLSALVVAAIGFGMVAFTIGRDDGLSDPDPDSGAVGLPSDRPAAAADLELAQFDTAIRGYRMAQVDRVLAASTATVRTLERRVDELETEVAALRGYPSKPLAPDVSPDATAHPPAESGSE